MAPPPARASASVAAPASSRAAPGNPRVTATRVPPTLTPSSATTGFIQPEPTVRSALHGDLALRRALGLFLPEALPGAALAHSPEPDEGPFATTLERVSALSLSPAIVELVAAAEHTPPYLLGGGRTALGGPQPSGAALVTSQGWRLLQDATIRDVGVVASGYPHLRRALPGVFLADGRSVVSFPGTEVASAATAKPTLITAAGSKNATHPADAVARLRQMALLHAWVPSSAYTVCPSAMQDGAVAVVAAELARLSTAPTSAWLSNDFWAGQQRAVLARALQRLLSRDPAVAWTSGQWMTERPGGSDVGGTETIATWTGRPAPPADYAEEADRAAEPRETDIDSLPLGPWRIDGFKWFSSAADGGCAVLLARTAKGLSCFFAPTRKLVWKNGAATEAYNGVRPQRLKTKLGTRALPTAELELVGMRAWLVGTEGQGVRIISAMLNITRVYNAGTAMSYFSRGLSVVRAFSAQRMLPSRAIPLQSVPLYARSIAAVTLAYRADLLLTFFVAGLLGQTEHPETPVTSPPLPASADDTAALLRVLTPVAKARTAKTSIAGLQECMEGLGGLGYLENDDSPTLNVARLFRDANVLSIWEGTTDVLATDTVKVLTGRSSGAVIDALDRWIGQGMGAGADPSKAAVGRAWDDLKRTVRGGKAEEVLADGRDVLARLGDIVCAVLLLVDARRDGDDLAAEVAARFVADKLGGDVNRTSAAEQVVWDRRIAFQEPDDTLAGRARL